VSFKTFPKGEKMTTEEKTVPTPELLSLKDLEQRYRLSPSTIKRERWEQKQVKQNKMKPEDVRNLNGFGYSTKPIFMYGKLYYEKQDVLDFIDSKREQSPKDRVDG
tara:strand:- start:113 stop:430 length:318 start_codon:yes stop_codon:yes gene_type:complete